MADNTTVGVAVPRIRDSFHLGVASLQWVVAGYVVAFAALLFTGGAAGDRFGRRPVLVAGIAVFAAGATVAALAADWRVLIAGRVVQGVGAAACEPGTLALLRQLHPDERSRARVFGGWAAASGVALAAGPVVAGLLVAAGGWRAVFAAEAVLAGLAAVAGAALLPDGTGARGTRVGLRAQALLAVTLAALTYGLIDGQGRGFLAPRVLLAWALACAGGAGLVAVERGTRHGALDLRLLRDRVVAAGLAAAAASTFALFAVLLLVSLELEIVGGLGGLATAGVFAPMAAAMVVAGPLGGRWVARAGPRGPLSAGLALAAAATFGLDRAAADPVPLVATAAALTALGFGFGLVVAPMVTTVLDRVPSARSGLGAAAVTAAREVGGVVGVAVLGAVVNARLFDTLTARLAALGIPVGYRRIVVDAVRGGASLPSAPPARPHAGHTSLLDRYLEALRQTLVHRTVDAGKAAYADSLRTALVVAAVVLAAGAVTVLLLLRHTAADTPETVR
jgi:MFS family permease